jgi:hypothetical protein
MSPSKRTSDDLNLARWFFGWPCVLLRAVRRRRALSQVFIAAGLIAFGLLGYLILDASRVAGVIAEQVFRNSPAPVSREMPRTAQSMPYLAGDMQILGGRGEGLSCSIPAIVETLVFDRARDPATGRIVAASVSNQMRQACVYHDYCYRHGSATYGFSQADCDYFLLEQAYRLCLFVAKARDDTQRDCLRRARKVVLGVRMGGSDSFRPASPETAFTPDQLDDCLGKSKGAFDHDCASTYFEFDPNPIGAEQYSVYRIADAPEAWEKKGALPKALYVFDIKPGGTKVSILGWSKSSKSGQPTFCAGLHLPATHGLMQSPPLVSRTQKDAAQHDWFAWWRWATPDNTAGRMVVVRPAVATLADWKAVFPGTTESAPQVIGTRADGQRGLVDCQGLLPIAEQPRKIEAARSITVGSFSGDAADNNFMQMQASPFVRTDGLLNFFALRSHSCGRTVEFKNKKGVVAANKPVQPMCYLSIHVDPYRAEIKNVGTSEPKKSSPKQGEQRQEPLAIRDEFNRNGCANEPDRYRNFPSPPLVLGSEQKPVFTWLRRGDELGRGFNDYVHMRRAVLFGTLDPSNLMTMKKWQSRSAGTLQIAGLSEDHEPAVPIFRASDKPWIASLKLEPIDGHPRGWLMSPPRRLEFDAWQLDPANEPNTVAGKDCQKELLAAHGETEIGKGREQVFLDRRLPTLPYNSLGKKIDNKQLVSCGSQLDPTWLARPAVVMQGTNKDRINLLMQRVKQTEDGKLKYEIRQLSLRENKDTDRDQLACELTEPQELAVDVSSPLARESIDCGYQAGSMTGKRICRTKGFRELRARPLLFADLDGDGALEYVLPHPRYSDQVEMGKLPAELGQ